MFEPKGERSQRAIVVDVLAAADYGETVSYESLCDALGGVGVRAAQAAVNQAKRALEAGHSKAVEAVRTVGYRVVEPGEQQRLAVEHQRKSRRSLVRARSKVDHVDLSRLSEGERAAATLALAALAAQIDFARRADLRYANRERVERFMEDQSRRDERTDSELAAVRERMARLEARLEG